MTWDCQERVSLAVDNARARDLSSIIDRLSSLQTPRRVFWDKFAEVHPLSVLPEEGVRIAARVYPEASDLAAIVDGVTAGSYS